MVLTTHMKSTSPMVLTTRMRSPSMRSTNPMVLQWVTKASPIQIPVTPTIDQDLIIYINLIAIYRILINLKINIAKLWI